MGPQDTEDHTHSLEINYPLAIHAPCTIIHCKFSIRLFSLSLSFTHSLTRTLLPPPLSPPNPHYTATGTNVTCAQLLGTPLSTKKNSQNSCGTPCHQSHAEPPPKKKHPQISRIHNRGVGVLKKRGWRKRKKRKEKRVTTKNIPSHPAKTPAPLPSHCKPDALKKKPSVEP